jgi:hypothetical protein
VEPALPTANIVQPKKRKAVTESDVELTLRARRVGASLSVEVEGRSAIRLDDRAFADPKQWRVRVENETGELQRLVNGPSKVAREQVLVDGEKRWDTVVTFNVVYAVPEVADRVDVSVSAPNGETVSRSIAISAN